MEKTETYRGYINSSQYWAHLWVDSDPELCDILYDFCYHAIYIFEKVFVNYFNNKYPDEFDKDFKPSDIDFYELRDYVQTM